MKKSSRKILLGALLALAVVYAAILFVVMRPPVRLEVVDRYPTKRIQFVNDTGRDMNFFFFTEAKSDGTWLRAGTQPKGARSANYVKPHSVREFEIAPVPAEGMAWRAGFSYQPAAAPRYLEWANRVGLLKNYRAHYFDHKTVYAEFLQ